VIVFVLLIIAFGEKTEHRIAYRIQTSAPASSCFTLSGYLSKLSQTTDFNFDVSAPGPEFCGTAVGRRARALMDVMEGLESAYRMTSVATNPVKPATMSFILSISSGIGVCGCFWEDGKKYYTRIHNIFPRLKLKTLSHFSVSNPQNQPGIKRSLYSHLVTQ